MKKIFSAWKSQINHNALEIQVALDMVVITINVILLIVFFWRFA
jgi:hypothetical protein